jgi:hypothetical protein
MERGYWLRFRRSGGVVFKRHYNGILLTVYQVQDNPSVWLWRAQSNNHYLEGTCKSADYAKRSAVRAARDRWLLRRQVDR